MRFQKILLISISVVCLAVLAAIPTNADTFMKQLVKTDAFEVMGQKQPANVDTSIMWMSDDKAYMLKDKNAYIMRADKGVVYLIDDKDKTYSEMSVDIFGEIKKAIGEDNENAEMVPEMMKSIMGTMKVTVTPTEETMKIGDWNAKKYDVVTSIAMGTTNSEIWASEDIKVNYKVFHAISNAFMAPMPGFDEMMKEMEKIKGMQVKSITQAEMMGAKVKSTSELLECSEKTAPAGIYDIPEGYKKVEMQMMPPGK